MKSETKNFLRDLVMLLHEKYNETLDSANEETLEDRSFRLGSNLAYYDILEIIERQAEVYGYPINELDLEKIAPTLGEKV